MLALTVQEPWPWAMLHCGKDVENRCRAPDYRLQVGDVFLVHSGQSFDSWKDIDRWDEWPEVMTPMVRLVSETQLRVVGNKVRIQNSGLAACTVIYDGAVLDSPSPWAARGQVHWRLKDVVPVSEALKQHIGVLRGLPGLFDLPNDVSDLLAMDRATQLALRK